MVLKILQNSQENTCARVSLLIKLNFLGGIEETKGIKLCWNTGDIIKIAEVCNEHETFGNIYISNRTAVCSNYKEYNGV